LTSLPVNGHIESTYSVKTGKWTAPEFIESPFLRIHGMAPALNYGQQCYEGLKAYRSPDDQTINVFRPQSNAERMQHSASAISIPHVPTEHFRQCVQLAVSLNAEFVPPHRTGSSMYVRPLLFGSSAQLGLSPPEEYTFVVFVMPTGVYHGVHPVDALILEDFDRAAPNGTGSAKVGGNYAPVLRFSDKARSEGFGITLHLDSATRSEIDEFSTSGFIGANGTPEKGITIVVPDSKNVIKSVTSDSVCEIAKSLGWKVECRPVSPESTNCLIASHKLISVIHQIKYEEISSFDEIMAAGTAAALVPIKSITMRSRSDKFVFQNGSDEPGPACVKFLEQLQGIQRGKIEDKFGWCDKVKQYTAGKDYQTESGAAGVNGSGDAKAVGQLP
jgi:branched-chain amino acid aminotransferase